MKRIMIFSLALLLALSLAAPAFAAKYGLSDAYDGCKLTLAAQYPAEGKAQSAVVVAEGKGFRQLIFCRRGASGLAPVESSGAALPQPDDERGYAVEMSDADSFTLSWLSPDGAQEAAYTFAQSAWTDETGAEKQGLALRSSVFSGGSARLDREWDEGLTFRAGDTSVSLPINVPLSGFGPGALPCTAGQAQRLAAALQAGYPALSAQTPIKTEKAVSLPVYAAPSEGAYRAANGKAAAALQTGVSLWGGVAPDNAWLLIEYEINPAVSRVGFVSPWAYKTSAEQETVASLTLSPRLARVAEDTFLTDDPQHGQRALAQLSAGSAVTLLAALNPLWAYVETEIDGQFACGFIPLMSIDADVSALAPEARIPGQWKGYAGGAGDALYFFADGTYLSDEGYSENRRTWRVVPLTDELMEQEKFWEKPDYVLLLEDGGASRAVGLSFASVNAGEAASDPLFPAGTDMLNFIYGDEGGGGYVRTLQTPPITQEEYDEAHG